MSAQELRRGLELARGDSNSDFGAPASDEMIRAAEDHLGVKFPPSYREFVATVGWCAFGGREFYGITRSGLEAKAVPSTIFATRDERRHGLPVQFLLVEDPGSEEEFVIDTTELGADGEGPIKVWTKGSDHLGTLEVVAEDFGTYLLRAAEQTLS